MMTRDLTFCGRPIEMMLRLKGITVDLGYCITERTKEICMLYSKIHYEDKLVVNAISDYDIDVTTTSLK